MTKGEVVIRIAGSAGDGVASVGDTLSKLASRSGLGVCAYNSYQSVIRGGFVWLQIRISNDKVYTHGDNPHILIPLNQAEYERHKNNVLPGGFIVYNEDKVKINDKRNDVNYVGLSLRQLAPEQAKQPIMQNTLLVGSVVKIVGFDRNLLEEIIRKSFGKKGEEIANANIEVINAGYNNTNITYDFGIRKQNKSYYVITGNYAVAISAAMSGCKFYSAYPMTPATSILHWFASNGKKYGIVVKQLEDEIAVINAAIGAGFAGARAMCGTSGGGFSLMTEAIGSAGMTETPVVIVNSMRGGPSTGLPTKTEQGDLFQALGASQGEYPKAILAPKDTVSAFYLTSEAFNLADRYQMPVIILIDFLLSNGYYGVLTEEIDPSKIRIDRGELLNSINGNGEYLRYKDTSTGVSPRVLPGTPNVYYVAATDEHDENGVLISDIYTDEAKRKKMMEKRMRKMKYIVEEFKLPIVEGDEKPDITLVGWGSTYGVIKETTELLREQSIKVNHVHIEYIYPVKKEIADILSKYKNVVIVENNYSSQYSKLLRMETGYNIEKRILKYDGEPFTPLYLLNEVERYL
ncbi:MAG: 2-oxoacid:acceptor oxidoreductase subunit alpha [Brevinematales bacterium]|nr:2-oxoacid:acceptor oxidoreductase subunit alpha [Brevinematales bacterium]